MFAIHAAMVSGYTDINYLRTYVPHLQGRESKCSRTSPAQALKASNLVPNASWGRGIFRGVSGTIHKYYGWQQLSPPPFVPLPAHHVILQIVWIRILSNQTHDRNLRKGEMETSLTAVVT